MVSKCPGDRTGANEGQVNRRAGDPRKLYFSLDLKLFSDLELQGAGIVSSSAIGPWLRAQTSWKGSNTTPAVVSKCPGDRTTPKKLQANRRVGDPRKIYFSLDLKLFSDLELLGAWIRSSSDIGLGPRAIGPGPRDQLALYTP